MRDCWRIIKKTYSFYFDRIQSFSKQYLVPDFLLLFLFTQVQVKLIVASCFTSTRIPKCEAPFDCLVFDIFLHAWLAFEFHHMLMSALKSIIWNRITKTLVKMVDKGSCFVTFVTFAIIRCAKNGDFLKYLQISIQL